MLSYHPIRIAILFSGRGSNMDALARHVARRDDASIVLTICNCPKAHGIERARMRGLKCRIIDHNAYDTRTDFEAELDAALTKEQVDLICAAGFMRLLSAEFVTKWHNRILNIHPSLLPKYRGLDTHRRVLDDGAREHGCTVHYMRPAMDDGPILTQRKLKLRPDDTPDTLAARVLELEHQAYPDALDRVLADMRRSADNLIHIKEKGNLLDSSRGGVRAMH